MIWAALSDWLGGRGGCAADAEDDEDAGTWLDKERTGDRTDGAAVAGRGRAGLRGAGTSTSMASAGGAPVVAGRPPPAAAAVGATATGAAGGADAAGGLADEDAAPLPPNIPAYEAAIRAASEPPRLVRALFLSGDAGGDVGRAAAATVAAVGAPKVHAGPGGGWEGSGPFDAGAGGGT